MQMEQEAANMIVNQTALLMIDGFKMLLTLSGKGAVRGAALIAALLQQQHKTRGAARLATLLRSGGTLEIYTIPQDQLKQWAKAAKQYDVLYTVVKDRNGDGMLDLFVRSEDAARINRMVERHGIGLTLQAEAHAEPAPEQELTAAPGQERDLADETNTDWLIDQITAPPAPEPDGKAQPDEVEQLIDQITEPSAAEGLDELLQAPVPAPVLEEDAPDPTNAPPVPLSETTSKSLKGSWPPSPDPDNGQRGVDPKGREKRPSIREAIQEIKAALTAAKGAALSPQDPGIPAVPDNGQPEK